MLIHLLWSTNDHNFYSLKAFKRFCKQLRVFGELTLWLIIWFSSLRSSSDLFRTRAINIKNVSSLYSTPFFLEKPTPSQKYSYFDVYV